MITIELYDETQGEELGMCKWPTVPPLGSRFTMNGQDYIISDIGWGTMCKGDGSPIMDDLCASLTLKQNTQVMPPDKNGGATETPNQD